MCTFILLMILFTACGSSKANVVPSSKNIIDIEQNTLYVNSIHLIMGGR